MGTMVQKRSEAKESSSKYGLLRQKTAHLSQPERGPETQAAKDDFLSFVADSGAKGS